MADPRDGTLVSIWTELADVAFAQRFVDVDGISTRVLEAGSGPPLVLLNGTSGHLECYARNIGDLAKDFRVIAFDTVGHGYTDKPDTPYTLPVYAEHLLGLLNALGIERASLSGESLGSWIAAWFAANHPDRVARLILNTPGNVLMKEDVMARIYESTMRAVREVSPETVRPRLEWLFAESNRWMVTDELVAVRTAIYSQPGFLRAVENILVLQDVETRRKYTWGPDWCGRIEAPTLVMATSDDPTGTPDEAKLLASWIPNAEFVRVEGAGHWPQWEKPVEFLALHHDFLGVTTPR
jgi:2-hydroxy-6-oxonona-2,4-dienedioate hydrolase